MPCSCFSAMHKIQLPPIYKTGFVLFFTQLELFPKIIISDVEKQMLYDKIKTQYWIVRNTRSDKFGGARRRKAYREVAKIKKSLRLGGIEKREILDYLACVRSRNCSKRGCKFCSF